VKVKVKVKEGDGGRARGGREYQLQPAAVVNIVQWWEKASGMAPVGE